MIQNINNLRSVTDLKGFGIVVTGGEIGNVEEFYFDDERWAIRYIVVNTGNWLSGRQVLISPFSVRHMDKDNRKLHISLTKSQVEKSPDLDIHKPVSRQMETTYSDYYGYPYYWGGSLPWGSVERPELVLPPQSSNIVAGYPVSTGAVMAYDISEDIHLRSTAEVSRYYIEATDGDMGHVDDFIIEENSWMIRYLAIDTSNWWMGQKVIISPQWIASIDWALNKVYVNLSREAIKQSPEYDSSKLISREYETQLYRYYGQNNYWAD